MDSSLHIVENIHARKIGQGTTQLVVGQEPESGKSKASQSKLKI